MKKLLSLRLAAIAFAGLALAGCDTIDRLSGPTDQFILQADMERAAEKADEGKSADYVVQVSTEVLDDRLEAAGIVTHDITFLGEGRVRIRTSGEGAGEIVPAAAGTTGELTMRMVDDNVPYDQLEMGIAPPGSEVLEMKGGFERLAVKRIGGIRGDRIASAQPGIDAMTGEPAIFISFDEQGGREFAILSRNNVGKRFAIILDDEVLSAPIFNEPILGGQAQISGNFTEEEAAQLAAMLQSGALPVTFELLEARAIAD